MPVQDNNLGLYFFNQVTGESRWTHPVDTVVRALVVSDRITTGSQDSFTEDFSTEEDLVISDLLRAQVSDLTHSDSDVNNLSNYIATALILAEKCTKATERLKKNPPNICITSVLSDLEFEEPAKKCENITCSNNSTNCDRNVSDDNKKKINFAGHSDTDVTCSDDINKTNVNSDATKTKLDICDIVKVNNVNVNSASKDIEENPKKTNSTQQKGGLTVRDSPNLEKLPVGYIECTQNSTMSGGGLGRGLGQLPLPPQPLGAPSSLAGPLPLSRPTLSRPSPGGPLVPPVGGLLTPLAPIAAASRVGPTQLAPLKPLSATSHSLPPNREGVGNPLLRRQLAHKEQQAQSDGLQGHRTQSGERATNTKTQAQSARHQQDKDVIDGLGSPPKSILKDPVLARGGMDRAILEQEGVDRLLLMQSNETKNLRFDFKTDDLQFHSSEEECDKEEMEEEEEEEEEEEVEEEEIYEYEDEEEEEFDSEAEDPEEEAILRAHGVIDDDSEGRDFMLNDATDLLPVQSKPHPQKLNILPHGPDPWADNNSVKPTLKVMSDSHNPLQHFRKQKGENKLGVAERQLLDNINQKTTPQQNKTEQQKKQVPGKDSLGKPKSAGTEACNSSISSVQDSRTGKPKVPNVPSNLTQPTTISGKTMSDKTNDAQNSPAVKKSDDVKKTEAKPQEDRKLELEGAPRNRKTNPLDRVVAKLSGRTENKEEEVSSTTVAAAAVPATVKNLTVNLNKLMNNEDESEEEKSGGVQLSGSVAVTSQDDIHQINLAAAKHLEAEKKKLQDKFEADIKALQQKLNKEYRDTEEKMMKEHKAHIEKFQEQEKKKLEQKRKEINSKLIQENNKDIEGIKIRTEKESNERKNKLIKEIEERNNEEIEKIKLEFAQDMQQKKEKMQREHEEEMHDLEKELQVLYTKEQNAKQEEVDAARASAATRSSNNTAAAAAAAAAATAELEKSLNELLRERQAEIKREHNKQLAILRDELDKILEKTAREAKEKETLEKKIHADSLAKMKESYEIEVRQLEEIHCENINKLEVQHEEDLSKLKSDFKAELTIQKTELENKLTEFKIEYDQRMNSLGQDELDEGDNDNDDDNDDNDKHGEGMESNRKNSTHEETFIPDVNVRRENGKLNEEVKKYDHILRELRERRRSLEEDLEALKTRKRKSRNYKLTS
nr:repetitive organellar protein-like [Procambarus clarkii]